MKICFKQNKFFLISIGSIPGALFRWQIDNIFLVNILGCFLLGIINILPINKRYKFILGFGFCGSFTTFSGWTFQLFQLLSQGLYGLFILNSVLTVLIGLVAVYLGELIAKKFISLV